MVKPIGAHRNMKKKLIELYCKKRPCLKLKELHVSSLHIGMFTTHELDNRRAVNFQGIQAVPTTLPDSTPAGMRHAR